MQGARVRGDALDHKTGEVVVKGNPGGKEAEEIRDRARAGGRGMAKVEEEAVGRADR